MSIKVSFMHHRNYITRTRVKLPVVFEELGMVYIFRLLFTFHYYCPLVKGQLQPKSGGTAAPQPPTPHPRFLRACTYSLNLTEIKFLLTSSTFYTTVVYHFQFDRSCFKRFRKLNFMIIFFSIVLIDEKKFLQQVMIQKLSYHTLPRKQLSYQKC